jgi:phosphohistidine phosphatase
VTVLKLYFLRHGIAEDHSPSGRDADRRLTSEGIAEMAAVAAGMAALGLRFDRIISSPKVRALHTAEIVAGALGLDEALTIEPVIGQGFSHFDLAELLSAAGQSSRVLIVGHQPDLSLNIEALIGGGHVHMKKAALALMDVSHVGPGGAELRWLLNADHLKRMG